MMRFCQNLFIFILIAISAPFVYGVQTIIVEPIQIDGQAFEIEKPIASGGFGHVYVVRSVNDPEIKYALKIFSHSSDRKSFNPQQMRAGRNKAYQKIIQIDPNGTKLKFTPRFVKVKIDPSAKLDSATISALGGHPSTDLVVVMPLAKSDLQDFLVASSKTIPDRIKLAIKFIDEVLPEMALLANNDLVHNDIKLENILVSKDGKFGITDFDTVVRSGNTMPFNTPYFLAPERQGRNISMPVYPISDIYSLGIVAGLIISPNYIATENKVDVRDSEVFSAYLEQLEDEVKSKHPEMLAPFKRVKQFLDASLDVIPSERLEKLTQFTPLFTTGRMKERRGGDRHAQDIETLRKALRNLDVHNVTSKYLMDTKRNIPDLPVLLGELARDNSLYIEAFLLAAKLEIEIPGGKALFYSKLRSAPFREIRQIENLKEYISIVVGNGSPADSQLLDILLRRFILPKGSDITGHEDIIKLISVKPEVLNPFNSVLKNRMSENPSSYYSFMLAQLYLKADNIPDEVIRTWLEIVISGHVHSDVSDRTLEAIKKLKFIGPGVMDSFLFNPADEPPVLFQKLRLLSALLVHNLVKVDFNDKRFTSFLHSDHAHVRWETANVMLENGFKNEVVQDIFVKDGIANKKTSATGAKIQLDLKYQQQIVNAFLAESKREDVASDMLFRQRSIDPGIAVQVADSLNQGSGARRMLAAFLLLKNESVSVALKKRALVTAADLVGEPGISSKTLLDQIRKSANEKTWTPEFESTLGQRKKQNAIEPEGIYSGNSCRAFYR